jgi:hypothetical protein
MLRSEILYLLLFIGVFPAIWILAVVLDRFLPSDSSLYSPQDERRRQSLLDDSRLERREAKQGQKERAATLRRSKSEEAYRARAAAALVGGRKTKAPSLAKIPNR